MLMPANWDPEWWAGLANFTNERSVSEGRTPVILMKQCAQKQQGSDYYTHSCGVLEWNYGHALIAWMGQYVTNTDRIDP